MSSAAISLGFLVLVVIGAEWRLWDERRRTAPRSWAEEENAPPEPASVSIPELSDLELLGWEFEYASTTASEAMQDRHIMVNYFLLITGLVGAAVGTLLKDGLPASASIPPYGSTALLWLLTCVGWLYFLKIVRLRQAWRNSAQAMNCIKAFYLGHACLPEGVNLREAFCWLPETLPPSAKRWTVFHYSTLLVALLSSFAFVCAGILLRPGDHGVVPMASIVALGLVHFIYQTTMYRRALEE